jgi:hypothetical protein
MNFNGSFGKESELDIQTSMYPLPKKIQKSSIFRKTNVMEYEIEAEFIHESLEPL